MTVLNQMAHTSVTGPLQPMIWCIKLSYIALTEDDGNAYNSKRFYTDPSKAVSSSELRLNCSLTSLQAGLDSRLVTAGCSRSSTFSVCTMKHLWWFTPDKSTDTASDNVRLHSLKLRLPNIMAILCLVTFCFQVLQGEPKNMPLYFCWYLCQLLTNFQNSFTGKFCRQFTIMWLS